MKVLIVEDDMAILRMTMMMVANLGHQATACNTGAAALSASLMQSYDLVLCDIGLPDIHGFELMRAIKAQSPEVPIVAISAMSASDAADAAAKAGASHYIEKPLRLEALRHELAMAQAARSHALEVVMVMNDALTRMRTKRGLEAVGCRVRLVPHDKLAAFDPQGSQLIMIEATDDSIWAVVRKCGQLSVPCFVLVPEGVVVDEDPWLRAGASLVVPLPMQVDAVIAQARFLGVGQS
jgi:CheY-like chemotaxis protein